MTRRPEGISPPEQKITLDRFIAERLPRQYRSEVLWLRASGGLLETLPHSRERGVLGIDGKGYPLPTEAALAEEMRKHKEAYETKINQGFVSLELTPMAMPLAKLIALFKKALLERHRQGKLFGVDYDSEGNAIEKKLDLDINQPVFVWDQLERADETGGLIYYPQQFTKDGHGGKTKQEILDTAVTFKGWNALLVENTPVIPRQGKGVTRGGRQQLEAGKTPNDYLKTLRTNPTYARETGKTPEDEITEFLKQLHTSNRVLHDYQNNIDSLNYLLASWVPASGNLAGGCWGRVYRRARLYGYGPGDANDDCGASPAVRMGSLEI